MGYGTRVIGRLRLNQSQEWRQKWPAVADDAMDIAAAAMRELPPDLDLSIDANGDLNAEMQRRLDAIVRAAIGHAVEAADDDLLTGYAGWGGDDLSIEIRGTEGRSVTPIAAGMRREGRLPARSRAGIA